MKANVFSSYFRHIFVVGGKMLLNVRRDAGFGGQGTLLVVFGESLQTIMPVTANADGHEKYKCARYLTTMLYG
ncbi:MAG: hypothetical protein EAZ92_02955 [Candidatus Kapaibacterium sp.]|nr:MAG: hypothetical protein EAZ92_02955 [Candidatus Kapabacteria bacterium]